MFCICTSQYGKLGIECIFVLIIRNFYYTEFLYGRILINLYSCYTKIFDNICNVLIIGLLFLLVHTKDL